MSVVVYIGDVITEKHLTKVSKFKAYLTPEEKEKIINDLKDAFPDIETGDVQMHIEIEIKKYDTKNPRV